jgi:hypothetical protein
VIKESDGGSEFKCDFIYCVVRAFVNATMYTQHNSKFFKAIQYTSIKNKSRMEILLLVDGTEESWITLTSNTLRIADKLNTFYQKNI